MALTFFEFFAGGGMAAAGLGPDWRCEFANDIDVVKAASYRANHAGDALVVKDVRLLTSAEIPGRADLAWASFPCQDLSLAGSGAGLAGQRSGTFWAFWHIIRKLDEEGRAPKIIALENVYGALTSNKGRDLATIASAFAGRDYRLGAFVLDAVEFVPQSRPRLFVVAVRKNVAVPARLFGQGPGEIHPSSLELSRSLMPPSVLNKWIWWHLPRPKARTVGFSAIVETVPRGVEWHSPEETQYILGLMNPLNRAKVEKARGLKRQVAGTIYRRTRPNETGKKVQRAEVRFDDVAGCLRTPAGGSSRQTIIIVNGDSVRTRLLSPREAARLMGLPDDYRLPSRYNDAYHLLGDGVVAPVVRHIAQHLFEPILENAMASSASARADRYSGRS